MNKAIKELKSAARETLLGNYGTLVGCYIIMDLLLSMTSSPLRILLQNAPVIPVWLYPVIVIMQLPLLFIAFILSGGWYYQYLKLIRGQKPGMGDIFYFFRHDPLKCIQMELWLLLYLLPSFIPPVIGTILLIALNASITGIVAFTLGIITFIPISYSILFGASLIYYIFCDHPEYRARDILKASFQLMKGQKLRLLILMLSFLGFCLLGIVSFGLALLWAIPYLHATMAYFYKDLSENEKMEEKIDVIPADSSGKYYTNDYWL